MMPSSATGNGSRSGGARKLSPASKNIMDVSEGNDNAEEEEDEEEEDSMVVVGEEGEAYSLGAL